MNTAAGGTVWDRGRFDARGGPGKVLFGRMYEDTAIELGAFCPGGRVLCIASAGCTAMALAPRHEVVAIDINPVQLAYAERRFAGEPAVRGSAEGIMAFARFFGPLAGWWPPRLREFLALGDPVEQVAYWHRHFDTRRFRAAFDGLLSVPSLRAVYAMPFLDFLPPHLGAVMRGRLERCFAHHPNRTNPYARALLTGQLPDAPPPPQVKEVRLVHGDAAGYLESQPAASFDGFTLSNILDGATSDYRHRLLAAVKRAARPDAMVVLRSFGEPSSALPTNHAAEDRSILWGIVDVKTAESS